MKIDLVKLVEKVYKLQGEPKNVNKVFALTCLQAFKEQLTLTDVSKRYFLFECINADRQKLKKLIIAPDRETAIADIETNYPYIEKWYSSEELNVC